MPRPISWLPRLHEITKTITHSVRSHHDRRDIEKLFELQPRAAQELLKLLPSVQVGTSRLLDRQVLADFLSVCGIPRTRQSSSIRYEGRSRQFPSGASGRWSGATSTRYHSLPFPIQSHSAAGGCRLTSARWSNSPRACSCWRAYSRARASNSPWSSSARRTGESGRFTERKSCVGLSRPCTVKSRSTYLGCWTFAYASIQPPECSR
ncbi:hypothetical protein AciX9_4643 (plasmid) [Granulicella tundricola MP5ACTX9]|uniref:Uncharacterized protein n=1 Tax=Granulicella tundricola (strain ATCC BAA-1859 / DSM 23138 / MP5ACTX9) TaxID=1198114 RepID=E8X7Y9_GRATM|nr:hypothetical protein AciX9_4643 [Granulicella tundricola MP5ACTX9]